MKLKTLALLCLSAAIPLVAETMTTCNNAAGTNFITCSVPYLTSYPNNWMIDVIPANTNTSPVISATDLAGTTATTACSVTSASHNFVTADVGALLRITAGTSWTQGYYQITAASSNAATLTNIQTGSTACGTTASPTSGTYQEGGAMISVNSLGYIPIQTPTGAFIQPNVLVASVPTEMRCSSSVCTIDGTQAFSANQTTYTVPYTMFTTFAPSNAIAANSTTDVVQLWLSQIFIPTNSTLTGACLLNGSGAADSRILALYNSSGALVANTALAGTAAGTASKFQCIAFTATVNVQGPQTYYLGFQGNGTTAADFQTYATGCCPTNYGAGSVTAGSFGTLPASITVPTTFTTAKGPIGMVY